MEIDKLWDFSDPAKSEAGFSALLSGADGEEHLHDRVEILTQIARARGLQQRFTEAHATLDTAETLCRDGMAIPRIRCLLERGRVFNSARQPELAKPLFLLAWEIARAAGQEYYALDAAHMLGICLLGSEALQWNERAMAAAEKSADARAQAWLGPLYNNMGWTYHDLGDFPRALELFEKSLAFRQERRQAPQTRIARWCIGRVKRSLARLDEALQIQRELLAEPTAEGESKGFVLEEMGECLLLLHRADEARPYFAQAHEELSKDPWLARDEPARLARLQRLGQAS